MFFFSPQHVDTLWNSGNRRVLLFAPRLFRLRAFGATTKREKIAQKLNLTPPMDELTAYEIEKSTATRNESEALHCVFKTRWRTWTKQREPGGKNR